MHTEPTVSRMVQVSECNMDLAAWQSKGEDKGSSVASMPSDDTIVGWARELFGM